MSIFNQPGRCSKDVRKRSLSDIEFKSATLHVLLNCPEVVPFLNHFVSQFGHDAVYTRFDTWFKQFMTGKGQEKAKKPKRRVEDNPPSFPASSEMPMPMPPPQGYSELPQHHQPYTFVQTPGLSSQGHRIVRPTYSPAIARPRGSQPSALHGSRRSMSHPHGSQASVSQPLKS
ncbi:uncharacterized protein LOC107801630 [Nicotiana tabacum]|uniref:Uncharacterized protein LOC107801630 n=3 Tax=Nicotiana tabacum TaxID=4097 RepID=A0AC58S3K7_TOBAC